MNVIFNFQDVEDVVKNGFQELGRSATEDQKEEYKEFKKMDCKAIFLLHQCVDSAEKFPKPNHQKKPGIS